LDAVGLLDDSNEEPLVSITKTIPEVAELETSKVDCESNNCELATLEQIAIDDELWSAADLAIANLSHGVECDFELSLTDILQIKRNDRFDLLFDLVDEELVNPLAHRASPKDMIRSENRKVSNVTLEKAFTAYSKEEQELKVRKAVESAHVTVHILKIKAAPLWRRVFCSGIDALAYGVVLLVVLVAQSNSRLALMGEISKVELYPLVGPSLIAALLIWILLNSLLIFGRGQTIGQKLLGIEVVNQSERIPDFFTSTLRTLSLCVTLLSCGIGLLPVLWGSKQPLHDRMAGTFARLSK
jgi:uncharacterized RDD family membrane protein YckC